MPQPNSARKKSIIVGRGEYRHNFSIQAVIEESGNAPIRLVACGSWRLQLGRVRSEQPPGYPGATREGAGRNAPARPP